MLDKAKKKHIDKDLIVMPSTEASKITSFK